MIPILIALWLVSVLLAAAALSRFQSRRKTRRLNSALKAHRNIQLGEFISYILFSVREYLTSVTSVTEQINLAAADPASKELGAKLQRIVSELNGKVGRMLESARLNTTTRAKPAKFDLKSMIKSCLDSAAAVCPGPSVRVRLWCDPQITPLVGDRPVLSCVFTSVFTNALEALGERPSGRLTISARLSGPHAEVEIADDAGGIPPEYMGRIFSPLFTTKAAEGNIGLGLSMSRRMMERIGGALTVRSENGRTLVNIRIPLKPTLPQIRPDEATWPARRRAP